MSHHESEAELNAALERIQTSADELAKQGREQEALELTMQRLDLVRRYYGESSLQCLQAKVGVAHMLLGNVQVLTAQGHYQEACEVLLHVDAVTRTRSPAFPPVEHLRLLARLQMDKAATVARFKQLRYKSATSFAKMITEAAEKIHAVGELPTAWLNYSAALSAARQHSKALGASYQAYQAASTIIMAHTQIAVESHAAQYILAALRLEDASNRQDLPAISKALVDCEELRELGSIDSSLQRAAAEANITEVLPRIPEVPRQRWGGILALIYRSIACEQEYLGQQGAALLTHRVGATTAEQCLGPTHFVTQQCKAALDSAPAVDTHRPKTASLRGLPARQRLANRTPGASGVPIESTIRPPRAASAASRHRPASNEGSRNQSSIHKTSSHVEPRPLWNGWFASQDTPPLHLQAERFAKPQKFEPRPRPASSVSRSASAASRGADHVSRSPSKEAGSSDEHHTNAPGQAPPLSAHDIEFLRQTYRLPRDPTRQSSVTDKKRGVQESRYYELLEEHRRFAAELTQQMHL